MDEYNFKIRDEEFKRRKELETEKQSRGKIEHGQQENDSKQTKTKEQEEQQQQNSKERDNQHQHVQQKEEEWQVQQQAHSGARKLINIENNKEKQQVEAGITDKQNKGAMAKDMGAKTSTSIQGNTPKSKNKPSKKKREDARKRQSIQHDNDHKGEQQKEGEVCKKFIMVDEQLGMDITPLQTQYMNPPPTVSPDGRSEKCQMNKGPIIDEYVFVNLEDKHNVDNQSLKDLDDDDETSEIIIRAFSPHPERKTLQTKFSRWLIVRDYPLEDYTMIDSNSRLRISTLSLLANQTLGCLLPDHLNDEYNYLECEGDEHPRCNRKTKNAQQDASTLYHCHHGTFLRHYS
ncbi:uncharacterized protein LOC125811327 [Solanum verrucosum]|uniref:uncharacterized protein LOC125811327 n=1 Tax=Solanum verrucosum TaxID=315347 RepID=UPI0020D07B3B|nr:uncharacterized protein LOC125811327 [Solanum verrucosum]